MIYLNKSRYLYLQWTHQSTIVWKIAVIYRAVFVVKKTIDTGLRIAFCRENNRHVLTRQTCYQSPSTPSAYGFIGSLRWRVTNDGLRDDPMVLVRRVRERRSFLRVQRSQLVRWVVHGRQLLRVRNHLPSRVRPRHHHGQMVLQWQHLQKKKKRNVNITCKALSKRLLKKSIQLNN